MRQRRGEYDYRVFVSTLIPVAVLCIIRRDQSELIGLVTASGFVQRMTNDIQDVRACMKDEGSPIPMHRPEIGQHRPDKTISSEYGYHAPPPNIFDCQECGPNWSCMRPILQEFK